MQSHNPGENEAKPRKQPQNIRFRGLKKRKTALQQILLCCKAETGLLSSVLE